MKKIIIIITSITLVSITIILLYKGYINDEYKMQQTESNTSITDMQSDSKIPGNTTWSSDNFVFENFSVAEDHPAWSIEVTNHNDYDYKEVSFKVFFYHANHELIGTANGMIKNINSGETKTAIFKTNRNGNRSSIGNVNEMRFEINSKQ